MRQEDLRLHLLDRARAVDRRLSRLATASWTDLVRSPAPGTWSAAQVFEHLCLSDDSYLGPIRRALAAAPPTQPAGGPETDWRPRLTARLLVLALEGRLPLPAPRGFRPGPQPRPDVAAAHAERRRELERCLVAAAPLVWTAIRFPSPVTSMVRLNLGDAFRVLVTHAERHAGQIDRLLDGGPKAGG